MKENKFRIWDKQEKQWFPSRREEWANLLPNGKVIHGWDDNIDEMEERRWEVCMCTGLHDKNGKEGYHNDITEDGYVIEWSDDGAAFYLSPLGEPDLQRPILSMRELSKKTIIGNICEKEGE